MVKTRRPASFEGWLTTAEVVRLTGTSDVTLRGWAKRGVCTAPYIHTDPLGRGRRAYWHPRIVEEVNDLRQITGRGVALELVKARLDRDSYAGSSMSSDLALHVARRWRQPNTGADLATVLGLPAETSCAQVFEHLTRRLATTIGLSDHAIHAIITGAMTGLETALHHCVLGLESVLIWRGAGAAAAVIAPKYLVDDLHSGVQNIVDLLSGSEAVMHERSCGTVLVSLEMTWIIRDLWTRYEPHTPLPQITLERGKSVRERIGTTLIEYDYEPMWSVVGDGGHLSLSIDHTSARPGGQSKQELYFETRRHEHINDAPIVPQSSAPMTQTHAPRVRRAMTKRKGAVRG